MELEELLQEKLPNPWNYGVTWDGRVFFVNESEQYTTWIHPVTNHPVQSGQSSSSDLPIGWEYAYTNNGVPYFIDNINQKTTFQHPVTNQQFAIPTSPTNEQQQITVQQQRNPETNFQKKQVDIKRQSTRKKSNKSKVVKAAPAPKRNPNAPVNQSGWLHKQEGGGLKSWKKRWFVLSDFCLFYYKDPSEKNLQGAISLPSYKINPCINENNINKKYAFKAEHQNLKTHFFAGENEIDTKTWMNVLSLATIAQSDPNLEKKLSQEGEEADEDAGFLTSDTTTPDDSEQSNMKRLSSNQLFPPNQQSEDPRAGHGHYDAPYDSHSQGSSSNRFPLDSSGSYGHQSQQRDPRYYQGQQNQYNNDQPVMDSSRNLNDPYRNQSQQQWTQDPRSQNRDPRVQQHHDPRMTPQSARYDPRVNENMAQKNNFPDSSYRQSSRSMDDRYNRGNVPDQRQQQQQQQQQPASHGYDRQTVPQNVERLKEDVRHKGYGSHDNERNTHDPRGMGYSNDERNVGYGQPQRQSQGYDSRNRQTQPSYNNGDTQYENNQFQHQRVPSGSDQQDQRSRYPMEGPRDQATDPRNPSSQGRDRMYSERPIDVPTNHSQVQQRERDSLTSDDGGFKQGQNRSWKGPNDYRSDQPQSYRNSYASDNHPQQQQYDPRQQASHQQNYPRQQGYQQQQQQQSQHQPSQQYTGQSGPAGSEQQLYRGQQPRMSSHSSRSTGSNERTPPTADVIRGYAHPFPPNQRTQNNSQQMNGMSSAPSSNQSTRSNQSHQQSGQNIDQYNDPRNQTTQYRYQTRMDKDLQQRGHDGRSHGQDHPQQQQRVVVDGSGQQRHFEPLTIDTSPIHEPPVQVEVEGTGTPLLQADSSRAPGRPPIPAQMMPKYVEELAQTRTPVTRNDMLTSMEISMQRKEKERLFFQYPEVKPKVDEEPIKTQNNQVHYTSPGGEGFSISSDISITPPPLPARNHGSHFYNNNNQTFYGENSFDSHNNNPVAFNKLDYSRSFNVPSREIIHAPKPPTRSISHNFGSYERSKTFFGGMGELPDIGFRSENHIELVHEQPQHPYWKYNRSECDIQYPRSHVQPISLDQEHWTSMEDESKKPNENPLAHYQILYVKKNKSTEEVNKCNSFDNISEDIYVTIEDDNTMTYSSNIGTSQSYTLPETFDVYDEDYNPGNPWYRNSDSCDEDEEPRLQRDNQQSSYRQNRPSMQGTPSTGRRQQGNEIPQNRYSSQPGLNNRGDQQYNQGYKQQPYTGSTMDRQRGSVDSGQQQATGRDRINPDRTSQSPYVGRQQYGQERAQYRNDDYNQYDASKPASHVPPSPTSDRRSFGATSNPYAELSTVHRASKTTSEDVPPDLPSRPPPTSGQTAAQELKALKRKSGDYSQEIQDKEEQRLNKHIAASFKRLSLGTELGMYSEFSAPDEDVKKSADLARRSLDWEVENSLFGSNLDKYSSQSAAPYGYNNQKYSTPNYSHNLFQKKNNYDSNKDNKHSYYSAESPKGFSDFVEPVDSEHLSDSNIPKNYGTQMDNNFAEDGTFSTDIRYPSKESYMENDDVAVVDMDRSSSKDIMEDIDEDVVNIKNRISSLKNLLDTETERMSPVDSGTERYEEKNRHEVASSLDSLESYPERTLGKDVSKPVSNYEYDQSGGMSYGYNESQVGSKYPFEQSQHKDDYMHLPPKDESNYTYDPTENRSKYGIQGTEQVGTQSGFERQQSFDSSSSTVQHERQSSLASIPSHHRQVSYDRESSFGQPPKMQHHKQHSYDRQSSFGSRTSSHVRQASLGLPPRDTSRQRRPGSLATDSKQGSRQSSFSNFGNKKSKQIIPKHRPQHSLDGNQNYIGRSDDKKGWKSLGQLDEPIGSTVYSSTSSKNDPWHRSQPASTLLEWKLSGSPFKGLAKDDSVLLDKSHSTKVKDNLICLQNRPMSYAEGLKPPLTKLEKLELENKISRSMGAINNVDDLEKETNAFIDDEGIERPGYDPEWETIQNVLKRKDPSLQFPQQIHEQPLQSGPPIPPKSPGMERKNILPPPTQNFEIDAIKEDPDMPDSDVLESRKLLHIKPSLDAQRLRLSISAGDLIGKSHEELVLLLIQLRRAQSRLEGEHNYYQTRLSDIRDGEKEYKIKRKNSVGRLEDALEEEHEQYMNLKRQNEEVEKQLEVHKPLVNLVDNMVTMGSLYGGDNLMLASQYKRHKLRPDQYQEPKEMIEFSRKHQEQKFVKEQEKELKKLTDEEIELEEKLQQLFELDKLLQEKSFNVTNLQENKEHLERTFESVKKQEEWETDPREHRKLAHQKKTIEQELTRVRQQLADSSRDLEETAAENAKVEHEVILLRKEVYGLNKNLTSPTLASSDMKTRVKLERELDKVTAIMEGLNKQGAKLQEVMNTLNKSEPNLAVSPSSAKSNSPSGPKSTYLITDIDSMKTEDMAKSTQGDNTRYQPDRNFREPPQIQRTLNNNVQSSQRSYNQQQLNTSKDSATSPSDTAYSGQNTNVSPNYTSNLTWNRKNNKYDVNQNSLSDSRNTNYSDQVDYQQSQQQYVGQSYGKGVSQSNSWKDRHGAQVEAHHNYDSGSDRPQYSPMDISQADDNTKRFFGILPKEKPKSQTLRDLKKRELERKSRERRRIEDGGSGVESESDADVPKVSTQALRKRSRSLPRRTSAPWGDSTKDPAGSPNQFKSFDDAVRRPRRKLDPERRKSAIERLFPAGEMNKEKSHSSVDLNSEVHVKRMSNIFTPKPFGTPSSKSSNSLTPGSAIAGYKSVSMSNPNMKAVYQNSGRLPSSVSSMSQPSPQSGEVSPPREGEPHDVRPDFIKPQVTFASVKQNQFQQEYNPLYYHQQQQQQYQRASPVTIATVHPVPNVSNNSIYSNNTNTQFNPSIQHGRSNSGTDYTVKNQNNANANFLQQFNTWKQNKQNPTATVRPLSSNNINNSSSVGKAQVPEPRKIPKSALKTKRGAPRRQTISSSQPMWFESPSNKQGAVSSPAGDLITGRYHKQRGVIRSESLQDLRFDDETIDRMVLYTPEKVEIPERYIPDSDDESVTEEEKLVRREKADKVRKMVIAQSLQDWKEDEIEADKGGNIHRSLVAEKQRREHLLDIRQALAKEVTQRSKEVAVNKRKAMSSYNPDYQPTVYDVYDTNDEPPPRPPKSFYA